MNLNTRRRCVVWGVYGAAILLSCWIGWMLTRELGLPALAVFAVMGLLVILVPQAILNALLTKWPLGTHPDGSPKIGYRFGDASGSAHQDPEPR